MKSLAILLLSFALVPLHADPWTEPLGSLQNVGPEGAGNAAASEAWKKLTAQGSEVILPTLGAMEKAGPLARNWMRTAVESVFERELAAGHELPTAEIKSFVLDRDNEPNARRLAFDLFTKVAPDAAAALVPGMIDDPSAPLRRDAVEQLVTEGKSLLADGKKDASAEVLRRALDGARDVDQIDIVAKLLREDLGQEVDLPEHFGFLMYWDVIAPFDNTDLAGFETVYPPEERIDLDATYTGKDGREVAWQDYSTSNDYGMVDFNTPFSPMKEVVGYAYTTFDSASARSAELRLGCKNAWKIWFNGKFLFGRDEYHRGARIDQYTFPVDLKSGENTILVKICQSEQEQDWTVQWEFQLRVCDETGTAILSTDRKPTPAPDAKPRRRPEN